MSQKYIAIETALVIGVFLGIPVFAASDRAVDCSALSNEDLRAADVGFLCKTKTGNAFQVAYRDPKTGSQAWHDLNARLIVSPIVKELSVPIAGGETKEKVETLEQAKKVCTSIQLKVEVPTPINPAASWRLPTGYSEKFSEDHNDEVSNVEKLIGDGILEVIWPEKDSGNLQSDYYDSYFFLDWITQDGPYQATFTFGSDATGLRPAGGYVNAGNSAMCVLDIGK